MPSPDSPGITARLRPAIPRFFALLTASGLMVACTAFAAVAPVYYFSDCQTGAATTCIPGNNAHAGTTPEKPKQDLRGFEINALPAGTQLLFARGGAWTGFNLVLRNLNVTPTQPLVFDSYAPSWNGNSPPWIKAGGSFYAFQFGKHDDTANDGGYTIRNLKLDGLGAAGAWGLHLRNNVRNVTLENLELTGFEIAIHSQSNKSVGNTFLTVRNNNIHHNSGMGMLGDASDLVIEGNTFANNNFSGTALNHAIYLGGHGRNGIVRDNTFANNSVVNGACSGGNFTVHGQWDGLLVEGNTITQLASTGGCYGISINSSYDSAEWFRNVVIRGNTLVNLGGCGICLTSTPGVLVEGNLIYNDQATYQVGILIPDRSPGPGDDADTGAIVRNNTVYFTQAGDASAGISARAGSKLQVSSNLIYFGARSHPNHYCFVHAARSSYTEFNTNLCHHAAANGYWSRPHGTLAAARSAGFDAAGLNSDPKFSAVPSKANGWHCQLAPREAEAGAGAGACQRGGK